MSLDKIPLQDAVADLVVSFAEQALCSDSIVPSDLNEFAISQAMDSTLSLVFRKLGLPTRLPENSQTPVALQQLDIALNHIDSMEEGISRIAANVGASFEIVRGYRFKIASDGSVKSETSPERRGKGIYFTPVELAEAVVTPALNQLLKDVSSVKDLRQISIVDPAAGCGAFLLASVRVGAAILTGKKGFKRLPPSQIRAEIASHCIFGVDIDPLAIATTQALVRAEVGLPEWDGEELDKHFHVADSVSSSMQDWANWFPTIFPNGFSLVVTNPPWSKLRPLRSEFFEHIDARVRLYQGTELGRYLNKHLRDLVGGDWENYSARMMELSQRLRRSPEYSLNNVQIGDPDLYKYFTERSLALLSQNGIAALLLPSGVLRAQGSAGLRKSLRTRGQIKELVEYINRQKLFDIHSMYRFCTILFEKGKQGGIKSSSFGVEQVLSSSKPPSVRLSSKFLAAVGGTDMLIPEVRTPAERDILYRIFRRYPSARKENSGWAFNFRRELDMTNDAEAFISVATASRQGYSQQEDGRWRSVKSNILLPVYEGRMVHQFDNVAKVYISGQGRSAMWAIPSVSSRRVVSHYLISEEYAVKRGWSSTPRVGYCEISGHANERTLLAALLPANCVCGNKVPVLRIQDGTIDDQLLWLAYANSIVVDWIMRRFVSTTINQFFWQNIPLPTRGKMQNAEVFLVRAAHMLSEPSTDLHDAAVWLGQRALIRAAIDVTVMKLYGLTDLDRAVLLKDFPQLNTAHLRGAGGGISLNELLIKANRALEEDRLDLENLEVSLGCAATNAAAAYTPKAQAKNLLSNSLPPHVGAEQSKQPLSNIAEIV